MNRKIEDRSLDLEQMKKSLLDRQNAQQIALLVARSPKGYRAMRRTARKIWKKNAVVTQSGQSA